MRENIFFSFLFAYSAFPIKAVKTPINKGKLVIYDPEFILSHEDSEFISEKAKSLKLPLLFIFIKNDSFIDSFIKNEKININHNHLLIFITNNNVRIVELGDQNMLSHELMKQIYTNIDKYVKNENWFKVINEILKKIEASFICISDVATLMSDTGYFGSFIAFICSFFEGIMEFLFVTVIAYLLFQILFFAAIAATILFILYIIVLFIKWCLDQSRKSKNTTNALINIENSKEIINIKIQRNEDQEFELHKKFLMKICLICYEEINSMDEYAIISCPHHFHKKCLDRLKENTVTCPLCKKDNYNDIEMQEINDLEGYNYPKLNFPNINNNNVKI